MVGRAGDLLGVILGDVDLPTLSSLHEYFFKSRNPTLPYTLPYNEYAWFTKRVLLLCCCRADIMTLENHPRLAMRPTEKTTVQSNIGVTLEGNAVYHF